MNYVLSRRTITATTKQSSKGRIYGTHSAKRRELVRQVQQNCKPANRERSDCKNLVEIFEVRKIKLRKSVRTHYNEDRCEQATQKEGRKKRLGIEKTRKNVNHVENTLENLSKGNS